MLLNFVPPKEGGIFISSAGEEMILLVSPLILVAPERVDVSHRLTEGLRANHRRNFPMLENLSQGDV